MNNKSSLVNGFKIFSLIVFAFSIISAIGVDAAVILVMGIISALMIYLFASILQLLVDIRDNSYQSHKFLERIEDTIINNNEKKIIHM